MKATSSILFIPFSHLRSFCLTYTIVRMRGLALLPTLWLLIAVVALHVESRMLQNTFELEHETAGSEGDRRDPDCGPLQKHRYRCIDPPLTRSVQAKSKPTPPTKIDTSGAAHHAGEGTQVVAPLPPPAGHGDGPGCGPGYTCIDPPLARIRDINAVVP